MQEILGDICMLPPRLGSRAEYEQDFIGASI